jgi:hypothetical protein
VFSHILVFGTVAAAVAAWALSQLLHSRAWWATAAALMVIHAAAAFDVFYDWSHVTARELTMQQTAKLTGMSFSGGIYVNYLFLAVWLADAAWSVSAVRSYEQRPRAVTVAVHAFIFFIIVNGAVIFADGWARVLGVAATGTVLFAWLRTRL